MDTITGGWINVIVREIIIARGINIYAVNKIVESIVVYLSIRAEVNENTSAIIIWGDIIPFDRIIPAVDDVHTKVIPD